MEPSIQITLPEISLHNNSGMPSWLQYKIIVVPRLVRGFFPGYKEHFVLDTDAGEVEAWMSSADSRTPIGDDNGGSYICTPRKSSRRQLNLLSLSDWYDVHPELNPGHVLTFIYKEPRRYALRV